MLACDFSYVELALAILAHPFFNVQHLNAKDEVFLFSFAFSLFCLEPFSLAVAFLSVQDGFTALSLTCLNHKGQNEVE
jgi:hypothetical protein